VVDSHDDALFLSINETSPAEDHPHRTAKANLPLLAINPYIETGAHQIVLFQAETKAV
jgi:hypothetical protein